MKDVLVKIETQRAPPALGPYSQGIIYNHSGSLLFVSGQLPINPSTGKLIEGDIRVKTKQVLDNIESILTSAGSSMAQVIRTEIFLTQLTKDYPAVNLEYLLRFNLEIPPARQAIGVLELPMGSPIEISCIAYVTSS